MKCFVCCLLVLLSPFFSGAQRNPCRLKIVVDKLANTKIAYTPAVEITNGAEKMKLHFYKTGHSIVFSVVITSEDLFCVDNASSAVVQFRDKSTITLKASNTGNCTGNFQSSILDNASSADIEGLANKTIISITMLGKGREAIFKETDGDAQRVQHYFKCVKDLEF